MTNEFKFVDFYHYCPRCKNKNEDSNNDICDECLSEPAIAHSSKPINFEDNGTKRDFGYFESIRKIKPYLYDVKYSEIDYEFANQYFYAANNLYLGGCSSIRKGEWYGRNFDWTYDESAEFIVRTPRLFGNFASIGVAGGIKDLSDSFVSSGTKSEKYKLLPFMLQDGINEFGVIANMNVVPINKSKSKVNSRNRAKIQGLILVRYILDNFITAKDAADYISKGLYIEFSKNITEMGYELHYMIADKNNTYAIECDDGIPNVIDISNRPYLTNFSINNVTFNNDGSVYTPETQDDIHNAIITNNVYPTGSGLERYNYICGIYKSLKNKEDIRVLLNNLFYTRAYKTSTSPSDPYWYSEFVGNRDLTVASDINDFNPIIDIVSDYYTNRSRDDGGKTWHTVHSSLYNIKEKKLYLVSQEDNIEQIFGL